MTKYILTRIYDRHTEMREVTQEDIEKEGLRLGFTETKDCDVYLDRFESESAFQSFWNDCLKEGAKVVLI